LLSAACTVSPLKALSTSAKASATLMIRFFIVSFLSCFWMPLLYQESLAITTKIQMIHVDFYAVFCIPMWMKASRMFPSGLLGYLGSI
jgi:tryptophan-rich sensory protein